MTPEQEYELKLLEGILHKTKNNIYPQNYKPPLFGEEIRKIQNGEVSTIYNVINTSPGVYKFEPKLQPISQDRRRDILLLL